MATPIASGAGAVLAALLAFAAAAPASAQCRLCETPTTAAPETAAPGELVVQVTTTLDFDQLVVHGTGDGSATLLPNGERSASGSIAAISGRATIGSVTVRGEAGRAVRIDMPAQIQLYTLTGGSIAIDDIVNDLPDQPTLDAEGSLTFHFGGRVTVSGDSDGDYGGDLPITVEYL